MRFAGLSPFGRFATRLATWSAPPYKARCYLARLSPQGFIAPSVSISHNDVFFASHVFVGDRVVIFRTPDGGPVTIGQGTQIHSDTIIETGSGGTLTIGAHTSVQPRCTFSAYKGSIEIGSGVQIAPNCAFYPYDHGFAAHDLIRRQPLQTKGGIVIRDDAWLGFGVIVLDGVTIGKGAVVGAGSVVTHAVPDGAIATGVPARVIGMRDGAADKQ